MTNEEFDEFSLALRKFIEDYPGNHQVSPIMYEVNQHDSPNNHKRFYTMVPKEGFPYKKEISISLDRLI